MAEIIPLTMIVATVGGFMAAGVIVQYMPDLIKNISAVAKELGVAGFFVTAIIGLVLAVGIIKLVSEPLGVKLGI